MSGGTYYSVLFGMNIAEALLLDMINHNELYNIENYTKFSDKLVTHVEKAVKINE